MCTVSPAAAARLQLQQRVRLLPVVAQCHDQHSRKRNVNRGVPRGCAVRAGAPASAATAQEPRVRLLGLLRLCSAVFLRNVNRLPGVCCLCACMQ